MPGCHILRVSLVAGWLFRASVTVSDSVFPRLCFILPLRARLSLLAGFAALEGVFMSVGFRFCGRASREVFPGCLGCWMLRQRREEHPRLLSLGEQHLWTHDLQVLGFNLELCFLVSSWNVGSVTARPSSVPGPLWSASNFSSYVLSYNNGFRASDVDFVPFLGYVSHQRCGVELAILYNNSAPCLSVVFLAGFILRFVQIVMTMRSPLRGNCGPASRTRSPKSMACVLLLREVTTSAASELVWLNSSPSPDIEGPRWGGV